MLHLSPRLAKKVSAEPVTAPTPTEPVTAPLVAPNSVYQGMQREIPCDPYDGALLGEDECDKEGMRVKKVAIYIDYHIIDEEDYMDEEDADPVKDILAWGCRALPFEIEFFGGLPKTFKMEYIEEEDLFCVSYDKNPKCAYEDASVAIADPDEDGNFPIIKREPIDVDDDDSDMYEDDGYYLVSGAGGIRRIVLTY